MSALDTQVAGNHYKDMVIQPVEFIHRNKIGFLEGCVIKRVCRWRNKDGVQDLRKAIHELQLLIEMTENPVMSNAIAEKITAARQVDLDKQNALNTDLIGQGVVGAMIDQAHDRAELKREMSAAGVPLP